MLAPNGLRKQESRRLELPPTSQERPDGWVVAGYGCGHSRLARLHSQDPNAARRAAGARESPPCAWLRCRRSENRATGAPGSCFPWAASRLRAASPRQISWSTRQNQPKEPPGGGAASGAGVSRSATAFRGHMKGSVGELASSAPKAWALTSRYPTQPKTSASSEPATETALQAPRSPHNARGSSDVERCILGGGVQKKGWESSLRASPRPGH